MIEKAWLVCISDVLIGFLSPRATPSHHPWVISRVFHEIDQPAIVDPRFMETPMSVDWF